MSLLELFCHIDAFCVRFCPEHRARLIADGGKQRNRARSLCESEILTLLLWFHQSGYRTFKDFYCKHVCVYWKAEFPGLVSYNRFIEYLPSVFALLCAYLHSCLARGGGLHYIDSTPLAVCHNRRIRSHRVFRGLAQRGKTTVGWFYGFKLHLVVTHQGELARVCVTAGNVHDTTPVLRLLAGLSGKVFGDKGYLSAKLTCQLLEAWGITLLTRLRKNMDPVLMLLEDKILLRKRGVIESVIDRLKNGCQIEHSRHRSVCNAFVHLLAGLAAYCHMQKKPTIVPKGIEFALP